jgi:hypothetical protein
LYFFSCRWVRYSILIVAGFLAAPFAGLALVVFAKLQFWPVYFLILLAVFWWRFRLRLGLSAALPGESGVDGEIPD